MKLMPRGDFNELNEAIVGIKRLGYTFEDLNKDELNEFIKYLLLLSGSGSSTVCESYIIKTLVDNNIGITESQLQEIDIPQILLENETLNEGDHLDTLSTGLKVGAATTVAGVAGIGAYISFLFKKKKIRKAMEALRDAKIAKLDQEKENYDELEKLKPILTKEEGADKIKNIEDKVAKDKESLKTFDADIEKEKEDVKKKIDQTKMKMQELGDPDHKDYESIDSKAAADAKADKEEAERKEQARRDHELALADKKAGTDDEVEEPTTNEPATTTDAAPETTTDTPKGDTPKKDDTKKKDNTKKKDAKVIKMDPKKGETKDKGEGEEEEETTTPKKTGTNNESLTEADKEEKKGENKEETKEETKSEDKGTAPKKEEKKDDGGGDEEAFGKLGVAKQALKKAQETEEQAVGKAKADNTKERLKIEKQIKDIKSKGSDEKSKKKIEKLGKEKSKISDANKKLDDEGTGEIEKAKGNVEKIKGQIETRKLELQKLNTQKSDLVDPAKVDAKKNKLKDNIEDADKKIEDVKKDMQPQGTTKEREDITERGKKKMKVKDADITAAQQEAGRVSGTKQDSETGETKSSSLIGKATGFASGYVKKLSGEHELEILKHEQDIMNQMDNEAGAKAASAKEQKAKDKIKDGDKEFKAQKDKTDASDAEMNKAEDGVAAKEAEREAEDKKKKDEADEAKRTGIQKQIEGLEKSIKQVQDQKSKNPDADPKKKEEYQYKIDRFKTKLEKAKEKLAKVGESFGVKFEIASLVSEFNSFLKEYDLVLEERKELKEEEKPKKESPKEDKTKPDTDTMDTPADPEAIPDDEGEPEKKAKKKESNPLIGKKVSITNMIGTDQAHLEGSEGEITYAWEEGERAPEGDLPRRSGDPELFTIKFDKPKDPMYPEINLTKDNFKEVEKKKDGDVNESFREKYYRLIKENYEQ